MAYRLYNSDVAQGMTDFNDEHYHILATKSFCAKTIAVIYDEYQCIVAYGLKYDVLNSIHWEQGHYFPQLMDAIKKYDSYSETKECVLNGKKAIIVTAKKLTNCVVVVDDKDYEKALETIEQFRSAKMIADGKKAILLDWGEWLHIHFRMAIENELSKNDIEFEMLNFEIMEGNHGKKGVKLRFGKKH